MCFYNLTNSFFSILPNDYERKLKDEIYGCFKHIGIPIETIYNMPIQDRRYFIMKHNAEQEQLNKEAEAARTASTGGYRNNGNLNSFAKLEQMNNRRGG